MDFSNTLVDFTKVFHAIRLSFCNSIVGPCDRVGHRFRVFGCFVYAVGGRGRASSGGTEMGILAPARFGAVCYLVAVDRR